MDKIAQVGLVFCLVGCQSGQTHEQRLADFDNQESQQLEAMALAESQRQKDVQAAAQLRREATAARRERQQSSLLNLCASYYLSPIDGEPICAIVLGAHAVSYGELNTNVQPIISADTVFFRTDAKSNLGGLETGIQVDSVLPIPFDRYLNEVIAVIDNGYDRLISQLLASSFIQLNFAYSPSLPGPEALNVELPIKELSDKVQELRACTQLSTS